MSYVPPPHHLWVLIVLLVGFLSPGLLRIATALRDALPFIRTLPLTGMWGYAYASEVRSTPPNPHRAPSC